MKKYLVMRQHLGDRPYVKDDERVAHPADVAHLVANGVLVEKKIPRKNKAMSAPKNKSR